MAERLGTLLDIFDAAGSSRIAPFSTRHIERNRSNARRFVFTKGVLQAMGHLLRDAPQAIIDNTQFALPPYPVTYLEFDLRHLMAALEAPTTAERYDTPPDGIVGYLIADGVVSVLVYEPGRGNSLCTPLVYGIDRSVPANSLQPVGMTEEGRRDVTARHGSSLLLAHMFGTTVKHERALFTDARVDALLDRYRTYFDTGTVEIGRQEMDLLLSGSVGDVRNIICLLLWLAQPRLVEVVSRSGGGQMIGNRRRPYAAHNIVEIRPSLTPRIVLRSFQHRSSPRRHEVRAFWRNFERTPGCEHDWPILPDLEGRFQCRRCPQWRVRVDAHLRGDATVGFATKDYKV